MSSVRSLRSSTLCPAGVSVVCRKMALVWIGPPCASHDRKRDHGKQAGRTAAETRHAHAGVRHAANACLHGGLHGSHSPSLRTHKPPGRRCWPFLPSASAEHIRTALTCGEGEEACRRCGRGRGASAAVSFRARLRMHQDSMRARVPGPAGRSRRHNPKRGPRGCRRAARPRARGCSEGTTLLFSAAPRFLVTQIVSAASAAPTAAATAAAWRRRATKAERIGTAGPRTLLLRLMSAEPTRVPALRAFPLCFVMAAAAVRAGACREGARSRRERGAAFI
mmetsp:Transcript_38798/g.115378  ORF Transcript_38798/g.115378 Transcript_38798/m.115378 type:complete len:279 (-) Transcript_38798:170-1006(-)